MASRGTIRRDDARSRPRSTHLRSEDSQDDRSARGSRLVRRPHPRRRRAAGPGRPARRHDGAGPARHARLALARSRRDRGAHHAVHGPVRAARCPHQADAVRAHHAEPGRVVVRLQGRADVRVRPPQGRQVPQRRPGDRRRRQVHVRALQGRVGQGPQGQGQGGAGRGAEPGALRAEGAVARLHGLLRHLGDRRGVDRAQEIRREGRRGRLQEGADRRRPRTSSSRSTPVSSWCSRRFPSTGGRRRRSSGW
jgi:hypothetical protein